MRIRHQHMRVAPLPGEPDLFDECKDPHCLFGLIFISESVKPFKWDSPAPSGDEPVPQIVLPEKRVPDFRLGVPHVGIDTSREAAARIRPHTARVREAIYLWLKTQGAHGGTCGEICEALGISGSTCRPRLIELSGKAKWAPRLPARIQRSPEVRKHMHVYRAL